MKSWSIALVLLMSLLSLDAEAARRLGGGKSIGKQSSNVTQREAAPAKPAAPATTTPAQNAAPATPAPATPAAAPVAPRKPWGAMLGGLAAGLGLAWLASSLGLGEAFGEFLLIALGVLLVMGVVGMLLRARRGGSPGLGRPLAYQGAGSVEPTLPRDYSPSNVGNDASARPFERSGSMGLEPGRAAGGVMIGSALSPSWSIPADFDAAGFISASKRNFVSLQQAWDRADLTSLRAMMTDDMAEEIKGQLAERETHLAGQPNTTEVVMLDAQLLGIEDLGDGYMASVEFSGMIREEPSAGPNPFREVWNMTKPKNGSSGWLVAGVQALQ